MLIWFFASMYVSCKNPVDPYNLSVEEKIKYERMIF